MTTWLSKCCRAPARGISGDEGTGYFLCERCQKPCDAYILDNSSNAIQPPTCITPREDGKYLGTGEIRKGVGFVISRGDGTFLEEKDLPEQMDEVVKGTEKIRLAEAEMGLPEGDFADPSSNNMNTKQPWWRGEDYRDIVASGEFADKFDIPGILLEHEKRIKDEIVKKLKDKIYPYDLKGVNDGLYHYSQAIRDAIITIENL